MPGRLLVSCFPGHGHLQPVLPLAAAYRRAGWQVLVATGPDLVPLVRRRGFDAVATGLSLAATEKTLLERRPDVGALPRTQRVATLLPAMFVDVAARSRIDQLHRLVREWAPDLVLHDVTEFAAPVAALRGGVPHVAQGISLVTPTAGLWSSLAPALDRLSAEHGVAQGADRVAGTTYLDTCPPSLRSPERIVFERVQPVRPEPTPARPGEGLPHSVDELPHRRTVHVTLGTVVNGAPGLLQTMITGAARQPVNVIATVGPDRDPATTGPHPPQVVVERYLPYAQLLPRCAAVVSHGGAGTLLATVALGLPSVLVPVGAEQALNARLATDAGVSVTVPAEEATAEQISTALETVLDDPGYAERARAVAAEIAAMPLADDLILSLTTG